MSRCPTCLQGLCKRHPLQDHGARAAKIKSQLPDSAAFLKQSYASIIQSQIDKLKKEEELIDTINTAQYKDNLERDRDDAERSKKRKFVSDEEDRLSRSSLDPRVISLMMRENSDEESSESDLSEKKAKKESKKKSKKSKKKKHKKRKSDSKERDSS
jgi:hypothetical protein